MPTDDKVLWQIYTCINSSVTKFLSLQYVAQAIDLFFSLFVRYKQIILLTFQQEQPYKTKRHCPLVVSTRSGLPKFPRNLVDFESPLQISLGFVLAYFGFPKRITRRTKKYSSIRTHSHRKKFHQRETMGVRTMEYIITHDSNIPLRNPLTAPLWPVNL